MGVGRTKNCTYSGLVIILFHFGHDGGTDYTCTSTVLTLQTIDMCSFIIKKHVQIFTNNDRIITIPFSYSLVRLNEDDELMMMIN